MSGDRTVPQRIMQLESKEVKDCLIELFQFEFENADRRVSYSDFYDTTVTKHSLNWVGEDAEVEL